MTLKYFILFSVISTSVTFILGNVQRLPINPINKNVKKSQGCHEDSKLNFTELSAKYGYTSEEHTVVTEDGYILTIFRIHGKKCADKLKRPSVILMHGLLQSSDAWLDAGPNAGLAYLISDACFDLWVGNQRGNYYCRRHMHLNPDKDPAFWHYSVDEMGFYDLPATIDYVLKFTRQEKLSYIGFSQAVILFLIMCSERPDYCDKANIFIGLAPASRLVDVKSLLFKYTLETISELEGIFASAGIYEVLRRGSYDRELIASLCKIVISEGICEESLYLFDSHHPGSITNETLMRSFGHLPAGTSVHLLAHHGQALRSKSFRKFDYGKKRNLAIYGKEQPPNFNISAMTVPFVVLYGKNDWIVGKKDVLWLVQQLPNVLEVLEVSDPLWNHLDVSYSQFTKVMIFPKINEYLLKYSHG